MILLEPGRCPLSRHCGTRKLQCCGVEVNDAKREIIAVTKMVIRSVKGCQCCQVVQMSSDRCVALAKDILL